MTPHLRYLLYVVRHKWFVFLAGLKTGAPLWALLIHDWSKLTPAEWGPYVEKFYGKPAVLLATPETERVQDAFDRAWLHHQHRNPHHWQHWLLREDNSGTKVLPMPERYVREMVADWAGAGRAITGKWEVRSWYEQNAAKMQLDPSTRALVEELLCRV